MKINKKLRKHAVLSKLHIFRHHHDLLHEKLPHIDLLSNLYDQKLSEQRLWTSLLAYDRVPSVDVLVGL